MASKGATALATAASTPVAKKVFGLTPSGHRTTARTPPCYLSTFFLPSNSHVTFHVLELVHMRKRDCHKKAPRHDGLHNPRHLHEAAAGSHFGVVQAFALRVTLRGCPLWLRMRCA